jgi:hypothetical protein
MHRYYEEVLMLPFSTLFKNSIALNVKIKGMSYVLKNEEFEYGMLYFNEKILNKFGFSPKDIYIDNYIKTCRGLYKVYSTIEEWKKYITTKSKISHYFEDLKMVSEAWNEMLRYVSEQNIEIDLFKILEELFVNEKYRSVFHAKNYSLFNLVDAKCNLDKAMPDGYIKNIIMRAFEQEIEDSRKTQYTYSIIDIINLGR